MLWTREAYIDLLTYRNPQREMLVELFGPLIGLEEEWAAQGATPGELDLTEFCFDRLDVHHAGITGPLGEHKPPQVLEETEEYVILRDYLGRTAKLIKATSTLPLPLDFPVKNGDDWRKIRHLYEDAACRLTSAMIEEAKRRRKEGALIVGSIPGGFDVLRELMGEEMACLAYYDQPELVEEILDTVGRTAYRVLEELTRHVQVDQLSVHEDMAGKHGPMVGPGVVEEFIHPYYRRTWDVLRERGAALFCQDSDGNMNPVIDAFVAAGVNVFYPCEPAAGMDVVALREKYGKSVSFKGGLDKHVLRQSKEAIRRELEYKLQPGMLGGGMVFGLDHRIPNGTPLEHYRYYVRTARELLGLPPLEQAEKGWCRMAF